MNINEFLQRHQLRHIRFGFYKLVNIRPTQRCPASCRHCSARSGPQTGQTATLGQLNKWAESIADIPGLEWISIEGGEPFFALPQLKLLLDLAHKHNIQTSVLTNAFWAVDEHKASKLLDQVFPISFLVISTDEFHEEYVPLRNVIHALRAARPHVNQLAVQVCQPSGNNPFLERFLRLMKDQNLTNIDIIEVPLHYKGRAADGNVLEPPGLINELPDGPCLYLGTPVLREDGMFTACCQQEVVLKEQSNLFQLGNLNDHSADYYRSQVNADVYLQTLRVFGPGAIAHAAMNENWGWRPRFYQKNNICDLCIDLASHDDVVQGFRKLYENPGHQKKLALGRSLLYKEDLPHILATTVI